MMMSAALGSNPLASPALSKLLGRLLDGMSAVDEQTGKANQAKFAHPITSLLVSGNQISVRAQIVSTKPIAAGTVIQMLAFDPQATDEKDLWLGVAGEGTVDAQGVLNMQVQKPDLGWMRPTELVVPPKSACPFQKYSANPSAFKQAVFAFRVKGVDSFGMLFGMVGSEAQKNSDMKFGFPAFADRSVSFDMQASCSMKILAATLNINTISAGQYQSGWNISIGQLAVSSDEATKQATITTGGTVKTRSDNELALFIVTSK